MSTQSDGVLLGVACALLLVQMLRAPSIQVDLAPLYAAGGLADRGILDQAYLVDLADRRYARGPLVDYAHQHHFPGRRVFRYLHPPALAYLFVPLSRVDYRIAGLIFRTLSLCLLLLAAAVMSWRFGWGPKGAAVLLLGLALWDPVRFNLELGQTNVIVLALLVVGVLGLGGLSGAPLVALACLFKAYALGVPLALFFGSRSGRKLAIATIAILACVHLAAYKASPDALFAYLDMIRDLSHWQFLWLDQQSMGSILTRIETGAPSSQFVLGTEAVVPAGSAAFLAPMWAGAVVVAMWILASRRACDELSVLCLGTCGGLMASPVLHSHYLVALAPAVGLLGSQRASLPGRVLLGAGLILASLPLHVDEARYFVPQFGRFADYSSWFLVTFRLGAVALCFAGVGACSGIATGPGWATASEGTSSVPDGRTDQKASEETEEDDGG